MVAGKTPDENLPEGNAPADKSSDKQKEVDDKISSTFQRDVGGVDRIDLNKRTSEERDPEKRLSRKTAGRGTYGECAIDDFKMCGKNKDTIVHLNNGLPEKIETANQTWQRDAKNSQVWHVQDGDRNFDLKADVRLKGDNVFANVKYENGNEVTYKNGAASEVKTSSGDVWKADAKHPGTFDNGQQKMTDAQVDFTTGEMKLSGHESSHAKPDQIDKGEQVTFAAKTPEQMVAHEVAHVTAKPAAKDVMETPAAKSAELPPMPKPTAPRHVEMSAPRPVPPPEMHHNPKAPEHVEMPPAPKPTPPAELPPAPKPIPLPHNEILPAPKPVPPAELPPMPVPTPHPEIALPLPKPLPLEQHEAPKMAMPTPHLDAAQAKSAQEREADALARAVAALPKISESKVSIPPLPPAVLLEKQNQPALPVLKPSALLVGAREGAALPHAPQTQPFMPQIAPQQIKFESPGVRSPGEIHHKTPEFNQPVAPAPVEIKPSSDRGGPTPVPHESQFKPKEHQGPAPIRATGSAEHGPITLMPSIPKENVQAAQQKQEQKAAESNAETAASTKLNASISKTEAAPQQKAGDGHSKANKDGYFTLGANQDNHLQRPRLEAGATDYSTYTPKMYGTAADGSHVPLQGNIDQQARQAAGYRGAESGMESQQSLVGRGDLDAQNYFEIQKGQLSANAATGHNVVINIYNRQHEYTGTATGHLEGAAGAQVRTLRIDTPNKWNGIGVTLRKR